MGVFMGCQHCALRALAGNDVIIGSVQNQLSHRRIQGDPE
jgi:hypothetical protein